MRALFFRWAYRPLMRAAHRYHWHYAPPIYPAGETQLWCKWCGFRQTIKRSSDPKRADPSYEQLIERGRQAWADVPNASRYVEELRGGQGES